LLGGKLLRGKLLRGKLLGSKLLGSKLLLGPSTLLEELLGLGLRGLSKLGRGLPVQLGRETSGESGEGSVGD
jgi:hypothetical protein